MAETAAAAVTMVRDDIFFLRKWVAYYGAEFGRQNLYVINHGYQDAVAEAAAGCNVIGIPLDDNKKFDVKRWRLLNGLVNGLLGYYTHVIVGDVDEFVVADPAFWTSLNHCLGRHRKAGVVTPFGLEVTHLPAGAEPDPIEDAILGPRRFVQIASDYAKPCVLSRFTRLARGGHYAEHPELTMPRGLYLFHMRYADRDLYADTMNRRNAVVAETGAEKPSEVMIGRHWFAGGRDDDKIFNAFAERPRRAEFGFRDQRGKLAQSWRKRDTKGEYWQFDDLPQDALYEVPERLFGIV